MATLQTNLDLPGKSGAEAYQAAIRALPKAGFPIWKLREIAYLVMAKQAAEQGEIDCNLMIRPGMGAGLTLACDGLSAEELAPYSQAVFAALRAELGL